MRRASAVPVRWAVFLASVFIVLFFSTSGPVGAQATDPLAGQPASIKGDKDDGTVTTVGPIAVADCEADPNVAASVTVADADETEETFTDGANAEFQFASEGITIAAPEGGDLNVPDGFDPGTGEVVSSTGITCGGETRVANNGGQEEGNGGPDDTQYGTDDREITVIVETIPKKPLPKTGGVPLLLGAGMLLACATLLSVRLLRP